MFDSFADFLAMGGYAPYVWGSYGVCVVLIIVLTVQSVIRWKRHQRELTLLKASRSRQSDE